MALLKKLGGGQGFLKAGFLGFAKSGKTYTATELAIGTRALMKHEGPIAFYDTESGSEFIASKVRSATGLDLIGSKSRSFDDLMAVAEECVAAKVSVLIVDSITHVWRELCDAYLKKVNDAAMARNRRKKYGLEFQDWGPIKSAWSRWTDWYLNSPVHVIICGRAGFEYDEELDEDSGKKKLVKVDTKMKVESEFGFEPSLLIEMDRDVVTKRGQPPRQVNRATIRGDRWNVINGKRCDDPTFEFFRPAVEPLIGAVQTPIDTGVKSDVDVDDQGADPWAREKRLRQILAEEILGELQKQGLDGQSADAKKTRGALFERLFGTRSWTAIEGMQSGALKAALSQLRVGSAAPRTAAQEDKELDEVFSSAKPVPAETRQPGEDG